MIKGHFFVNELNSFYVRVVPVPEARTNEAADAGEHLKSRERIVLV